MYNQWRQIESLILFGSRTKSPSLEMQWNFTPRDFMGLKFPYASKEKKIIGPEFLSLKGGFSFLPWSKVPLPSERQLYDHKTNV